MEMPRHEMLPDESIKSDHDKSKIKRDTKILVEKSKLTRK